MENNEFKITVEQITDEELDAEYGSHNRYEYHTCFRKNEHYYCQMLDFVLHISSNQVINRLHNSSLDDVAEMVKIPFEHFKQVLLKTIFELDIYEFTKNKDE